MSAKRHPDNERLKRRYLEFLRDVKGRDEASLDAVAKALERFEEYNRYRDFRKFRVEQAQAFKADLVEQRSIRTGKPLAASTISSTLATLRSFFIWLADQPEYRSRIRYSDAEYFNPPENLSRIASTHRAKKYPSLAQVRQALEAMPTATENRAPRPGTARLCNPHWRARPGDNQLQTETCGLQKRAGRTGRARSQDQAGQDVHDLVFPGGR